MSEPWKGGSDSRWRRFRLTILGRDRWTCTLALNVCTIKATEVHHIQPLSKGGAKYDPSNCTASCKPCNLKQGDRAPIPQPKVIPLAW